MKAMSYESIDPSVADRYLEDDGWVAEQKLDGVRVMIHSFKDSPAKFGDPAITFAAAAQWFERLAPCFGGVPAVIDGELIIETGEFWAYDLPYLPVMDVTPETPFEVRRNVLEQIVDLVAQPFVKLVPQARTTAEKRDLFERVQASGAEGVVFKRTTAKYHIGVRTRDVLKAKFTKTMDVVITGRDKGGKNAELSLMRDGELVVIGACSMIGKPDLQVGECAEVMFLYIADPNDPRLYQPRLLRARPDKTPAGCEWRQVADVGFTNREVVTL
jgi:ATP-dependent DNA ligase